MLIICKKQPTNNFDKIIGKSPKSCLNFPYLPHIVSYTTSSRSKNSSNFEFWNKIFTNWTKVNTFHPLKNNRWFQHHMEAWPQLWPIPFATTLTAFLLAISHYVTKILIHIFLFHIFSSHFYIVNQIYAKNAIEPQRVFRSFWQALCSFAKWWPAEPKHVTLLY